MWKQEAEATLQWRGRSEACFFYTGEKAYTV